MNTHTSTSSTTQAQPSVVDDEPCFVNSEVSHLQRVIVHRPGEEVSRITPSSCGYHLFDEMLWLDRAQQEHDELVKILRSHGTQVSYLDLLLEDALSGWDSGSLMAIGALPLFERRDRAYKPLLDWLDELPRRQLAQILIHGLAVAELPTALSRLAAWNTTCRLHPDALLVPPLPNLMFTRDSSAWVLDARVRCFPRAETRRREAAVLEIVYSGMGASVESTWNASTPSTFEGGDLILAENDYVLIGTGQRTDLRAALTLARRFLQGGITTVSVIALPDSRATIHLDTLLSRVGFRSVLLAPLLDLEQPVLTLSAELNRTNPEPDYNTTPLKDALGSRFEIIQPMSRGFRYLREQWDEANNVLAVNETQLIAYESNTATNELLHDSGFDVTAFPGAELRRARGGPRCLSCPVYRIAH